MEENNYGIQELATLREYRDNYEQILQNGYEGKNLTELNEIINQLTELQTKVDELNEQVSSRYASRGDYDVDAMREFAREYPDITDSIYNSVIDVTAYKNQMIANMRSEFIAQKELQNTVLTLNNEIKSKEETIAQNNRRIEDIKKELDYNINFSNQINQNLVNLNADPTRNSAAIISLTATLNDIKRKISDLNYELSNLLQLNEGLNRQINDLKSKINELEHPEQEKDNNERNQKQPEKNNSENNVDNTSDISSGDDNQEDKTDEETKLENNTSPEENNEPKNQSDKDETIYVPVDEIKNGEIKTINGEKFILVLDENETLRNYSEQGFDKNAFGEYFNPWISEYDKDYDPIKDREFQKFKYYKVVKVLNEEATMQKYINDGFGKNVFGEYFNPWIDEYDKDYNPLNDPEYQVFDEKYILVNGKSKNNSERNNGDNKGDNGKNQNDDDDKTNDDNGKNQNDDDDKNKGNDGKNQNDDDDQDQIDIYSGAIDEDTIKEQAKLINYDALDKYFGNKEKAEIFKLKINRIYSHIIEKDGIQTIEDYPEYIEDINFCNVVELKARLERYSKGPEGYRALYIDLVNNDMVPVDENGNIIDLESFIITKADDDRYYIETNNQNYDKHKTTRQNLYTIGKFGEKIPNIRYQKIKDANGNIDKGKLLSNITAASINTMNFIMHDIKAPIYRAVGKHVFVPIHKLIYKDKIDTPYDNDITHRFTSRVDYFEDEIEREAKKAIEEENEKRVSKGKKVINPVRANIEINFKKLIGAKIKAVSKYKEGNFAVIDNGFKRNFENEVEYEKELIAQNEKITKLFKDRKETIDYLVKIDEEIQQAPIEKINKLQEERQNCISKIESIDRTITYINQKIGRKQNDLISMENHEKANRENITRTASLIKLLARLGIKKLIGPKIKELIIKKTEKWVENPTKTTEEQVVTYDKEKLGNTTFKDIENSDQASYEASQTLYPDRTVTLGEDATTRGAHVTMNLDGKKFSFSGSDMYKSYTNKNGIVYLTTEGNLDINDNTNVFDFLTYAANQSGYNLTKEQLITMVVEKMAKSDDPRSALEEMFPDFDKWMVNDGRAAGIPDGWAQSLDGLLDVIESAKKVETITHTTGGGGYFDIDYELREKLLNGFSLVMGANDAIMALDAYELIRRTKPQVELLAERLFNDEAKKIEKKYQNNSEEEKQKALENAKKVCYEEAYKKINSVAKGSYSYKPVEYDETSETYQMIQDYKNNKGR